IPAGQITQPITNIAYGPWTFERSMSSTATDSVTFMRIGGSYQPGQPYANPRYAAQISTSIAGGSGEFKFIAIKYPNVNMFASDTQQYTFAFSAECMSTINVNVVLIKNFGSGGSTQTVTTLNITPISVSGSFTTYAVTFKFGNNNSQTIGPNDDDYLKIAI